VVLERGSDDHSEASGPHLLPQDLNQTLQPEEEEKRRVTHGDAAVEDKSGTRGRVETNMTPQWESNHKPLRTWCPSACVTGDGGGRAKCQRVLEAAVGRSGNGESEPAWSAEHHSPD